MAERMTRDEYERRRTPLIDKDQDQQFMPAGSLDFSAVRQVCIGMADGVCTRYADGANWCDEGCQENGPHVRPGPRIARRRR